MRIASAVLIALSLGAAMGVTVGCEVATNAPLRPMYPYGGQPPPGAPPSYPQQGYPPLLVVRPMLAPLGGEASLREEVRYIVSELVATLTPEQAQKIRGVPLKFDPDASEINAFAGCEEDGRAFLAVTQGLLDAVFPIAQTQATDELFGTRTYDAYMVAVVPPLVKTKGARATLPGGIIPPQLLADPRVGSRARELYGEVVAFTMAHELSHHYLGHTGCETGASESDFSPALLGHIATTIVPGLNQPNELAADTYGTVNTLTTGRARLGRPAYRWTERGAVTLFAFFTQLQQVGGASSNVLLGFLRTHPNPQLRMPNVRAVADDWRRRNPG